MQNAGARDASRPGVRKEDMSNLSHSPAPVTTTCGLVRPHVIWTPDGEQIETILRERCVMPATACDRCGVTCALHHRHDCPRLDQRATDGWEVLA